MPNKCQDASSFKISIIYLITDKGHEKTTSEFFFILYLKSILYY